MTLLRRALNDARTAQAFQLLNPERNMKTYTGTKTLRAKPMTRDDYITLRGWATSPEENGADEGYLVEYLDGGKANHPGFENYISWSPKDVFERTYKDVDIAPSVLAPRECTHRELLEIEAVSAMLKILPYANVDRASGEMLHEFLNGVQFGSAPAAPKNVVFSDFALGSAEARLAGQ